MNLRRKKPEVVTVRVPCECPVEDLNRRAEEMAEALRELAARLDGAAVCLRVLRDQQASPAQKDHALIDLQALVG